MVSRPLIPMTSITAGGTIEPGGGGIFLPKNPVSDDVKTVYGKISGNSFLSLN